MCDQILSLLFLTRKQPSGHDSTRTTNQMSNHVRVMVRNRLHFNPLKLNIMTTTFSETKPTVRPRRDHAAARDADREFTSGSSHNLRRRTNKRPRVLAKEPQQWWYPFKPIPNMLSARPLPSAFVLCITASILFWEPIFMLGILVALCYAVFRIGLRWVHDILDDADLGKLYDFLQGWLVLAVRQSKRILHNREESARRRRRNKVQL